MLFSHRYLSQQPIKEAEDMANVTAKTNSPARKKDARAQTTLQILPNMQFLYELHLAMLELRAFGLSAKLSEGLREFAVPGASRCGTIYDYE